MRLYEPPALRTLRLARVGIHAGMGVALAASRALIPQGHPLYEFAGFRQDESSEVAGSLAYLRDYVMHAGPYRWAAFDKGGQFVGVSRDADPGAVSLAAVEVVPLVGDAPIGQVLPAGDPLPGDWPVLLALACDRSLTLLRRAQRQAEVPSSWSSAADVTLAGLPLVAIIVAGAAVAVIGAVAAWRYLDPDARASIAATQAAATAYAARVETFKATGSMPAASELEIGQAKAIIAAATVDRTSSALWGAGIAMGVIGAGVGGAVLGQRFG